jgi:Protein of unknown function (DUF2917)
MLYTVEASLKLNSCGRRAICTGYKVAFVHLLFPIGRAMLCAMTEAVLQDDRNPVAARALPAGGAEFTGDRKLSQVAVVPRESWLGRVVRAAATLGRKDAQAIFASGTHQISGGGIERRHLPKGGRIRCKRGRVWITADGGGEDVVLSGGEYRWFRPGVWLLIEAIANSEIIVEA